MININGATEAVIPSGDATPVILSATATISYADSVTSAPLSRKWSFESYPSSRVAAPSLSAPSAASGTSNLSVDGGHALVLTRTETDGTVNISRVFIGVKDAGGFILVGGNMDPELMRPLGATAAQLGWAGGASSPMGDVLTAGTLRFLRDTVWPTDPAQPIQLRPGAIDVTALLAAIAARSGAGRTVMFNGAGDYTFSAPFVTTEAHSGWAFVATSRRKGKTRILRGYAAPSVSLADNNSNALISCIGTVDTSYCNTTLSANMYAGYSVIHLAASITVTAGQWLQIRGNNDPSAGKDEQNASDGINVVLSECVQVATSTTGTTITLVQPLAVTHGAGVAVKGVRPASDIQIDGIDLACDGGTVAVGAYFENVVGLTIDHLSGAGFSRSLLETKSTHSIDIGLLHGRGENNALWYVSSTHGVTLDTLSNARTGKRYHANGIIRALLSFYDRPTRFMAKTLILRNACSGVRPWGGQHYHLGDILCDDLDATMMVPAAQGGGDRGGPALESYLGIAWDGGCGHLGYEQFGFNGGFTSLRATNCYHRATDPSNRTAIFAVMLHDSYNMSYGSITVFNNGQNPDLTQPDTSPATYNNASAVCILDSSGGCGPIDVRGYAWGLRTKGNVCTVDIPSFSFQGPAGPPSTSGIAMSFNHAGGNGSGPKIGHVSIANAYNNIAFDNDFITTPDYELRFGSFRSGNAPVDAREVVVAKNDSGVAMTTGDLCTINPAAPNGVRSIVRSASGDTRCAAVVDAVSTATHYMITQLPGRASLNVAVVVTPGAFIIAGATPERAIVGTPTDVKLSLGHFDYGKTGAALGLVPTRP